MQQKCKSSIGTATLLVYVDQAWSDMKISSLYLDTRSVQLFSIFILNNECFPLSK